MSTSLHCVDAFFGIVTGSPTRTPPQQPSELHVWRREPTLFVRAEVLQCRAGDCVRVQLCRLDPDSDRPPQAQMQQRPLGRCTVHTDALRDAGCKLRVISMGSSSGMCFPLCASTSSYHPATASDRLARSTSLMPCSTSCTLSQVTQAGCALRGCGASTAAIQHRSWQARSACVTARPSASGHYPKTKRTGRETVCR